MRHHAAEQDACSNNFRLVVGAINMGGHQKESSQGNRHLWRICWRVLLVIEGNTAGILPFVVCTSQENMIIQLKQCSKKEVHVTCRFLSARNMSEAEVEVYSEDTRAGGEERSNVRKFEAEESVRGL